MPKIIRTFSGFFSAEVALMAGVPYLLAWPAVLLAGWNSDRLGERRWHLAGAFVLTGAGFLGSLWTGNSVALTIAMFSMAAIGYSARNPPLFAMPHSLLGGVAAAAGIGAINCIGNLGGFTGPYLLGALSTRSGSYSSGVALLAAACFLGAILALLVRRTVPVQLETPLRGLA